MLLCLLFQYEVDKMKLTSRTLWLTMWDWDMFGKNKFLGEVSLPLSDAILNGPSTGWYPLQDKVKIFPLCLANIAFMVTDGCQPSQNVRGLMNCNSLLMSLAIWYS